MYEYVIRYTWMWNALFISPNLRKDLHTWCTLTLIMGLLPLSTMAYGNNLQVAVKFPHHNHHFNDSHLIQSLSRIPSSSMLFRQLQNVFSGCLQPGLLFFFHRVSFSKNNNLYGKTFAPGIRFVLRHLMSFCTVESLKRRPIKRFTSKSVLSTEGCQS